MHNDQIARELWDYVANAPSSNIPNCITECRPSEWKTIADWLDQQTLRPYLYYRLRQAPNNDRIPAFILEELFRCTKRHTYQNLSGIAAVRHIAEAFMRDDIPVIVLKGIYLAQSLYQEIGLRGMLDIDILVPKNMLVSAETILIDELGYRYDLHDAGSERRVPEVVVQPDYFDNLSHHHLPPLRKPGALKIELHWSLTHPRESIEIDYQGVWSRAIEWESGGRALVLEPVDLLIYTCIHAGNHRFRIGLKLLLDIKHICERLKFEIEWETLVSRAIAWKARRSVMLALAMAKQFAGADVPDEALEGLRTQDWGEETAASAFEDMLWFKMVHRDPWDAGLEKFFRGTLKGNKRYSYAHVTNLCAQLFPSRKHMVKTYPRLGKTPFFPLAYIARLVKIAGMCWHRLKGSSGKELQMYVRRRERIAAWLNGE